MTNGRRRFTVNKLDYCRVLVTETLPYETPIIFSNDGLYRNTLREGTATGVMRTLLDALVLGDRGRRNVVTIPYTYKIRKNTSEYRRLALMHPLSQWAIKNLYETYENLIVHYCSSSPISIRAPHRIATSFYTKSSWENINRYKAGSVSNTRTDGITKHSTSYFSYRGHDRLYKFFDSRDFLELEKKYSVLQTLDVSKCFDSIYTHSLSWATKDKEFTKSHVSVDSTFGQTLDVTMRNANHNETNGILIGPEVSRIFAEIIFQAIDIRTLNRLRDEHQLIYGTHFAIRRYVDDLFIFTRNEKDAQLIFDQYSDSLNSFNLHTNSGKSTRITRPFFTKKSRVIRDASTQANLFFEKFLAETDDLASLRPNKIHYKWRLTRSFFEAVKSICSLNEVPYDEVASYLVSAITERVKKLANADLSTAGDEDLANYRDSSLVLMDALFFLYSVAPSVSSSYKLATSMVVMIRFAEKNLLHHKESIKEAIYALTKALLSDGLLGKPAAVQDFTWLESRNILLASRELGANFLLPAEAIEGLFGEGEKLSYFDIICGLFYVRREPMYRSLRRKFVKAAEAKLRNLSGVSKSAEKAHLLLDMLTCPYIYTGLRRRWVEAVYRHVRKPLPSANEIANFINSSATQYWFVNWEDVDLLNSLEKKELKQTY